MIFYINCLFQLSKLRESFWFWDHDVRLRLQGSTRYLCSLCIQKVLFFNCFERLFWREVKTGIGSHARHCFYHNNLQLIGMENEGRCNLYNLIGLWICKIHSCAIFKWKKNQELYSAVVMVVTLWRLYSLEGNSLKWHFMKVIDHFTMTFFVFKKKLVIRLHMYYEKLRIC